MRRDAGEWTKVLRKLGVTLAVADAWGPVFASEIHERTFNKGERDLKDFLPTILHESAMLTALKENLNYSAARIAQLGKASAPGTRWRSLVPRAVELAAKPEAFANALYSGRMGNRDEASGDGWLYRARGLIGVTGADNYRWLGDFMGQDLLGLPDLISLPHYALDSAIAWWEGRVPDSILGDDRKIRRVVNGGYIGLEAVEKLAALTDKVLA
jgi:putative chitinase